MKDLLAFEEQTCICTSTLRRFCTLHDSSPASSYANLQPPHSLHFVLGVLRQTAYVGTWSAFKYGLSFSFVRFFFFTLRKVLLLLLLFRLGTFTYFFFFFFASHISDRAPALGLVVEKQRFKCLGHEKFIALVSVHLNAMTIFLGSTYSCQTSFITYHISMFKTF